MIRTYLLVATILLGVAFVCPPLAYAQDFGVPDSAYFGVPTFHPDGCNGRIAIKIPVYLWSDRHADILYFGFTWSSEADCDTVRYFSVGTCDAFLSSLFLNNEANVASDALLSQTGSFAPTLATQKLMECVFHADLGDTLDVWFPDSGAIVHLGDFLSSWVPSVIALDAQIIVPSTVTVEDGDADASGTISVSDPVFLVQYIFAGGCSPYDVNAADSNGDCFISISDAVYLINYIFGGGPAPVAGCKQL